MENRLAAQNSDTPLLHLRRRRCTSHTQKRRLDRAHNAPVLADHVDVRPPPAVSIDTPPYLHPTASMQVRAAGVDRP